MSIIDICQSSFTTTVKNRGRGYFDAGQVLVLGTTDSCIEAAVSGSGAKRYLVNIDLTDVDAGDITASCSCPHYDDGFLCKHIWATLLEIDHDGLVAAVPIQRTQVVHDHDYEDGEAGEDLIDLDDSGSYPQRTTHRPTRRLSGSSWQEHLQYVAAYASAPANAKPILQPVALKQREAWFVLNVAESSSRGQLVVDFRQRETKKDGTLGKIKKLNVRTNEPPEFTREEDARLVALLLGNQPMLQTPYGSYDFYGQQTFSQVSVAPALYDILLPRLCRTGRFVWQWDSTLPAEEAARIEWDDAEPWRFRLLVEDDSSRKLWRLSGRLYRGEQTVPMHDAVLLMATGIVLFTGKLARLEVERGDFGWIVGLQAQSTIEVTHADRDKLLDALYSLPQFPEVELPAALQVEAVQVRPQGRLEIKSPEGFAHLRQNQLHAKVDFVYGEQRFRSTDERAGRFDGENNRGLQRNREQEAELVAQLAGLGLQPAQEGYYVPNDSDLVMPERRLPEVVAKLTQQGWVVESQGVRIRRPGSFNLSVTSDVDWFELDGQVDFDGVTASLPDLLKALRNKDQYIRLDDGSQGMLPQEWLEKYGHLAQMAQGARDSLRFAPSQALLLDALLAEQENVHVDPQFAAFRDKLRSFEGVKPSAEPRGFHGELREYQKEGLGWLHFLREFRFGGCLADDMGLGKTVQVLALLQSRQLRRPKKGEHRRPSIVVVPKSLVFNWIDEAARFTPKLRVLNYTGTDRKQRMEDSKGFDIVVTTYGTMCRDVVRLKEMHFDYAILDESQAIKNQNSQASKAARLISADYRLAMTGTPVENHLGELWSLFEFLNPGMLGGSTSFNSLAKNGMDDHGNGGVRLLAPALRPFLLRRTKVQVLTELPEKTEQTLYCEMSSRQRKAYNELRDYYRSNLSNRVEELGLKKAKIHVLEALLRLRQAACHPGLLDAKKNNELSPKLETLVEQLREVIAEGHKALVFSQFTSLLSIVRQHLDSERFVYEYLDGRTRKRGEKVKRFQEDPACPLFLISLKAGGHGLNLTAADYVFILDPWWNPAVEAQAIDRAHRIGQTRPVFAYRIICRDTVEDKILELQKTKRGLADAIVSADNSLIRSLTAEDLQLLLS